MIIATIDEENKRLTTNQINMWEDAEQWLRTAQLLTAENYELSGSVNSRYQRFSSRLVQQGWALIDPNHF